MKPTSKILLLAASRELPYRVLRCFWEIGATVVVLGAHQGRENPRALAWSRCCSKYIDAPGEGFADDNFSHRVNRVIAQERIDLVVPTDQCTTRLLVKYQNHLDAETFPVLEKVSTFDSLNDKRAFADLCLTLGIRHPETIVCENKSSADQCLRNLELPQIAKPCTESGGAGVHVLTSRSSEDLHCIDYSPILLQSFIEGHDESISALCFEGVIKASVTYRHTREGFCFFEAPDLHDLVEQVVKYTSYHGVVNFDARRDAAGNVHLIECNPRFWLNMDFAMLAGLNFAELGTRLVPAGELRVPNQTVMRLGQMIRDRSFGSYLGYLLRDPVPTLSMMVQDIYNSRIQRLKGRGLAG